MKKFKLMPILALLSIALFWVACNKDNPADQVSPDNVDLKKTLRDINPEKADVYELRMAENPALQALNSRSSISYIDRLCPDETYSGTASAGSIGNSANWDYYYFEGNTGDVVTILARRTGGCGMDPAFSLYFGTTTSSAGVNVGNGGPDMTFLAYRDDNVYHCGSCWSDPLLLSYVLPFSGTYTVAVYDYISCGGALTYDLTIEGISCTIVIEGCDTGVNDQTLPSGQTMSEAIAVCQVNARNHGQFVSCVAHLTNAWVSAGYISEADKDAIMQCAAESNN
jgi:hypothetical protein